MISRRVGSRRAIPSARSSSVAVVRSGCQSGVRLERQCLRTPPSVGKEYHQPA